MEKNYGLLMDEFNPEHYFLGGGFLGTKEMLPSGDWSPFAPLPELQNRQTFDTFGCARFGTLNALEILFSFVLRENKNFSDRFLCIVSGASRNGDSPHNVAETIRKIGLIDEIELPFSDDIDSADKYYSPNPMTPAMLKKAKEFLKMYSIGNEWVYPIGTSQTVEEQNNLIIQALKRSPVGASVSAWSVPNENGGHTQQWAENHYCVILNGIDKDYWSIYDSYDNIIKKYSKKSKITMAKIYTIRKLIIEDQVTMFHKFWNWVMSLLNKEVTTTNVQPAPVQVTKEEIKKVKVAFMCLAIQKYEGFYEGSRSFRNNNPGNLKWRSGMLLANGQDSAGFARFATYKDGFMALSNKITNAATGKSTVYFPTDTLLQFFQKYAPYSDKNRPDLYAEFVADQLGVGVDFQIKNLV